VLQKNSIFCYDNLLISQSEKCRSWLDPKSTNTVLKISQL